MYGFLQTQISSNTDLGFRMLIKSDNFPPRNIIKEDVTQNIDPQGKGKKLFIINLHKHLFQRCYSVFLQQGIFAIFIVYVLLQKE